MKHLISSFVQSKSVWAGAGSNVGSARRWHPFTWRGPACFATNSDSYVAACLCSLQILQVVFRPSRVVEQIPTEPVVEPVVPMGSMGPWVSSKSCSSQSCLKAHGRIVLVDSLMSEVLWHIMAPCRFNLGIFREFRLGSSAKRTSPQWTNTSFAHDSAVPKGCSCNMKQRHVMQLHAYLRKLNTNSFYSGWIQSREK